MPKRITAILFAFLFVFLAATQIAAADAEPTDTAEFIEPVGSLMTIEAVDAVAEDEKPSQLVAFSDDAYLSVTLPTYGYYYSLNNNQKDAYKRIKYAIDTYNFATVYFDGTRTLSGDELGVTYAAVLYDNPAYFWMYGGFSQIYNTSKPEAYIGIILYSYYYTTLTSTDGNGYSYGPGDETLIKAEQDRVNSGCKKFLDDRFVYYTDAQKARIIHDNLVKMLNYDITATTEAGKGDFAAHTIYGAFADTTATSANGTVVCDGYAKAYKFLLDKYGIKSYIASGISTNSISSTGNHAWNVVNIGGVWYDCDVTWDDPIGGNNTMINELRYDYFNLRHSLFSQSHRAFKSEDVANAWEVSFCTLTPQGSDEIIEAVDYTYPTSGDFVYEGETLCKYNGVGGIVRIDPKTTALVNGLFQNKTLITELHIPASVAYIGSNCVNGCTRLKSIYLYGNETTIQSAISSSIILYHLVGTDGWTGSTFTADVETAVNMKASGKSETVVTILLNCLLKMKG